MHNLDEWYYYDPSGLCNVAIVLHQDAYSRNEEISKAIQNLSSTVNVIHSAGGIIQMTIAAEHLPRITEFESVKSIELLHPVVFGSDRGQVILKVEDINKLPGLASSEGLTGNITISMCFLSLCRSNH